MSAFIVSEPTMQKVVCGIQRVAKDWTHLRTLVGVKDNECTEWDTLGARLFNLNRYAVTERYGNSDHWPLESYETCFVASNAFSGFTDIQCLKAMKCLRYQCSEGDTDTKPLYLALEACITALMSNIIDDLPEYAEAKWGE